MGLPYGEKYSVIVSFYAYCFKCTRILLDLRSTNVFHYSSGLTCIKSGISVKNYSERYYIVDMLLQKPRCEVFGVFFVPLLLKRRNFQLVKLMEFLFLEIWFG